MVLVPEVIKAIKPIRDVPVLAAGGIMTGRQMAACMAMGAAGAGPVRFGSRPSESETTEIFREKMIAASSRDAVRSKGRTGKPARQLRSVWTDAWDRGPDSPGALPMPLQSIISRDAFNSIDRAAAAGNVQARDLVSYFVGQGVGLIDSVKSAGAVVQEFKEDFVEAVEHMNALVAEFRWRHVHHCESEAKAIHWQQERKLGLPRRGAWHRARVAATVGSSQ